MVGKKMQTNSCVTICRDGSVGEVREALESGADVNVRHRYRSMTSLMSAVDGQNEAVVAFLLEQPAIQINLQYTYGRTALHYAAYVKNRSVIKSLLNFPGIDTEVISKCGNTALDIATKFKNAVFREECQMKTEEDIEILNDDNGDNERTGNNLQSKKRKGEEQKYSQQTNMWKKMKTVQRRQKAVVEEVMRHNKEKEEEVVRVERGWLEELDWE